MRIPFNKSTCVVVGAVLAAHCALLGYAIYSTNTKSQTPPENTSLVFVDIPTEPSGPTESNTVAEQAAGKNEPKKNTPKKPVTQPKNQPKQPVVQQDKTPPIKTTKSRTASNDVASTTQANSATPTNNSPSNQSNTPTNQSSNTGKGNAAGSSTGSSNSSTPAGGGGNSNTVVHGGSVNIAGKYPPQALENGSTGVVRVSLTVMPNGSITNVRLIQKHKENSLNRSAMQAAQSAKVKPAIRNGQPVQTNYEVNVRYALQ